MWTGRSSVSCENSKPAEVSAFVVTFLWLGLVTQGDIYTVSFWHGFQPKPPNRELMLKVVVFMLITCALPALGVVHHYQQRRKKDDHVV
jgi:hypothetical protein